MITYKVVGFIANCHQSIVEANQDFDTHQEEGSLFQDMFTNPSENFSGLANKGLSIKGLPLDSRGVFFHRQGWSLIQVHQDKTSLRLDLS